MNKNHSNVAEENRAYLFFHS